MSPSRSTPKRRTSAAVARPNAARNWRSNAPRRLSSGGSSGVRRGRRRRDESNLDVAVLQVEGRTRAGERRRLLERARLDDERAADRFLRLHERAFDDLASAHGEARPGLIVELVGAYIVAAGAQRAEPGGELS